MAPSSVRSKRGKSSGLSDYYSSDPDGGSPAPASDTNVGSDLDTIIDDLYEKRATTREKAISRLITFLSASWAVEELSDHTETLLSLLTQSIKKGGTIEATEACHALGILAVTVGTGPTSQHMLKETAPMLERAVLHGPDSCFRVAAAESLAVVTFVGSEDPCEGRRACTFLSDAAQRSECAPTTTGCLRGWALLASALPDWIMTGEFVENHLAILHAFLHHNDVELRAAAGEALALLQSMIDPGLIGGGAREEEHAAFLSPSGVLSGDDGDGEASTAASLDQSIEVITDRMKALATNRAESSVKKRSKKDRAATKSTFRTLQAAFEDGHCPETHVRLKYGDVLTIDTWDKTIQLGFLRRYLATGFQQHLQYNPLLHDVFEIVPRGGKGDEEEGRGKRGSQAAAKAMTTERKDLRRAAFERKGSRAMLAEDYE